MTDEHKALVEMLNAAGHDERLSDGMLYLNAAAAIESLSERAELHRRKNDQEKT